MRKIALSAILVLVIVILSTVGCARIETTYTYSVSGTVSVDNTALDGVEILINAKRQTPAVTTDASGNFTVSMLKAGDMLTFKKDGYKIPSYKVKGSVTDLLIAAQKLISVAVEYDENCGEVVGAGVFTKGETVTLTATPKSGYYFKSYTLNDETVSLNAVYSFSAADDVTLTALFSPIYYTVSITADAGDTVSGAGDYRYKEEVVLSAEETPTRGFDGWYSGGDKLSSDMRYSFVPKGNVAVTAVFYDRLPPVSVTTSADALNWTAVDGAVGYDVYVDGVLQTNTSATSLSLHSLLPLSGDYELSVVAVGDGDVKSSVKASFQYHYYKPIGTPADVGVLFNADGFYLGFSRVNAAVDYVVYLNGVPYRLSDYPSFTTYQTNSVAFRFAPLATEATAYEISVLAVAADARHNSLPSAVADFYYFGTLPATTADFENGVLRWTSVKQDATYTLIIEGVVAASGTNLLSYSAADLATGEYDYEIRVGADGYLPSSAYGVININ